MDEEKKLISPMIFDDPPSVEEQQGLINPMIFDAKDKHFEEKIMIILYELEQEEDTEEIFTHIFSVCIGRTQAYFDIKTKLESGLSINIHTSKIITETKQTETKTGDKKYYMLPWEECLTVYAFCTNIQEFYGDDGFNIEDYKSLGSPEDKDALESNIQYLTPDQKAYRDMLFESIANRAGGIMPLGQPGSQGDPKGI